jgi:hypothetical protein
MSFSYVVSALALTSPQASATTRRQVLNSFLLLSTSSSAVLLGNPTLVEAAEEETDISVFLGAYTDPINHPGGFRSIELSGAGFAGYQLAKVKGGGGRGEPESYELPAMIFQCPGNRNAVSRVPSSGKLCITIDFTPKGGPADFTGYWDSDQKGIRFILDGNFWPKQ